MTNQPGVIPSHKPVQRRKLSYAGTGLLILVFALVQLGFAIFNPRLRALDLSDAMAVWSLGFAFGGALGMLGSSRMPRGD